jgi:Domain of unknown function (DUF4166)
MIGLIGAKRVRQVPSARRLRPELGHLLSDLRFRALIRDAGLEEYVGYGIGVALRVHVSAGVLVFRSAHYFVQVLGMRIRLPHWLTPGVLTVTHAEVGDGQFRLHARHSSSAARHAGPSGRVFPGN